MTDLIALHRRAAEATAELVATVEPADLDRPTPCAGWTVRDLLAHQIVQNHGFAEAAAGLRTSLERWTPVPPGDDPVAEHTASVEAVITAFAAEGVLERDFWLPEVREGGPFPGRMAVGFHFIDCVVHDWDFARALGVPVNIADDLAEAALPLTLQVPDTPESRGAGKAFARGLAVSGDAPALTRILAALGRDPS
ncbi:TIGR03086 family metal-binding protein [Nonomuraea sp. NBC_01738]|uniref:TIGR03086 family metal-binding protein n=1 Tax=Nonomuraea sp. NBC_01738 TaxID=2976003 RepID=UPI002E12EA46|nr:TIGR03086 family metal-binding protein [Nonomuraea sp. NBC_01738]